jgi:beta-galactosidase
MVKMGYAMVKYGLKFQDAVSLYGKYVANWGGEATVWQLEGKKDGHVTARLTVCPSAKLHLEVKPSKTVLHEGDTYDMAALRIRVLDEYGNIAPYAQLPVKLHLEGPARLIGPDVVTAEGGMTGTYIKTTGESGEVTLTVSTAQTEAVTVRFTVSG